MDIGAGVGAGRWAGSSLAEHDLAMVDRSLLEFGVGSKFIFELGWV